MMDSADRFVWIFGGALVITAGMALAWFLPSDITPIFSTGLGMVGGSLIAIGTNA